MNEDMKPTDILPERHLKMLCDECCHRRITNFVLHLLGYRRADRVTLSLKDFDLHSDDIPLIANLQPSGEHFVEDLYYAGETPAVMKEILPSLHVTR